ncbi:MAG: peroxide stress protein YaaA [Verrucomicrobiae bacterium]|nr:peroxide stress protein YaaA [Verrucomicrobiae bacterium]
MIAVISPAKTLDYESRCPSLTPTEPEFLGESESLIKALRKKRRPELQALMGISENLADLNYRRYRDWSLPFTEDNARPALLAFKGDVYTGFTLDEYTKRDFEFAQQHLRILSGLYGLLRPLDLMQPYRLEMGTGLKTARGKDLYAFWDRKITHALNEALRETRSNHLINLASNEYFRSVRDDLLDAEVVTPVFKDLKNGEYRIISFFAKKARGMMSDFLIRNRIKRPEDLKDFDRAGYRYNAALSEGTTWLFTRDRPADG